MTRDTIFRVANGEADHDGGLRLVERGKLSLEAPVPDIDPVLAEPQVLDGFDPAGKPVLRPAKRPIALHDLLTHTAGFVYAMGQCRAENITRPSTCCRPPSEASCCTRR
jgi:methyl acetate hydrolase